MELIHMNGRVYDPDLGRFISVDPFIQAPLMSQSLNRYSYVMNNPLSLVDPSGYSWLSKKLKSAWDSIRHNLNYIAAAVLVVVGAVATAFQLYPLAQAAFTAAAALIKSPVQVGYSGGDFYLVVGYGGFGVQTEPILSTRTGSPPPMTPPPGAVSIAPPSLPEWMVDEFAGIGDSLTFGLTRAARDAWGIGSVDTTSQSYAVGYWGTAVLQTAASAGTSLYMRAAQGGVRGAVPAVMANERPMLDIIQSTARQEAARGRQYLMRFLTTDEAAAYTANPAKGARFIGTAIHRATRRALDAAFPGRYRYNPNKTMDFVNTQTGELVELTTEADAMRHAVRYRLDVSQIATYQLPP